MAENIEVFLFFFGLCFWACVGLGHLQSAPGNLPPPPLTQIFLGGLAPQTPRYNKRLCKTAFPIGFTIGNAVLQRRLL